MSEVASVALLNSLRKQLAELEEGKNNFLQQYFPAGQYAERGEFEILIDNYLREVEQFIKENKNKQLEGDEIPFVAIGSEVEIVDLANHESFKYRIVSPDQGKLGVEDISFLSPVGKALLLKRVGDVVEVKAPGGVFSYRVKAIKMSAEALN